MKKAVCYTTVRLHNIIAGMSLYSILFYIAAGGSAVNTAACAMKILPDKYVFALRKSLCAMYTGIIVYLLMTNPLMLLNMFTLDGVCAMFQHPLVVIGSIIHFSVGDIRVLNSLLKSRQMNPIVQMSLIGLCFVWSPVVELITFCIFARHIDIVAR